MRKACKTLMKKHNHISNEGASISPDVRTKHSLRREGEGGGKIHFI
jgi:hypothetical protein